MPRADSTTYIVVNSLNVKLVELVVKTDYGFGERLTNASLDEDAITNVVERCGVPKLPSGSYSDPWIELVEEKIMDELYLDAPTTTREDDYGRTFTTYPMAQQLTAMLWYCIGRDRDVRIMAQTEYSAIVRKHQKVQLLRQRLETMIVENPDNVEL